MRKLFQIVMPLIGTRGLIKYIFLGILSGLCSFLFINCITVVVGLIMSGNFTTISKEYILMFASVILLFIWVRRTLAVGIINLSQTLFWDLRKQILLLVLKANYQQLDSKRVDVHTAILSDVHILIDVSLSIIQFFTAAILTLSCLIYLLSISWVLFLITLAVAAIGVTVYQLSANKNLQQFHRSRSLENKFTQNFNDILHGFKEIYIEPKKGRHIYEQNIKTIAADSFKNNKAAFTGFLNNQITGQVLFYLLISSILLYFSITLKITPGDTVSYVFALLFLLGSIETIMALLPGIMRARVASNHLLSLKQELEEAHYNNPIPEKYISKSEFEKLSVKNLAFHYKGDDDAFSIGPIDFNIRKGEVAFIYGGNGSGKTTFIHSMLGLCNRTAGEIRLNNVPVTNDNYPEYRTIYSVVFTNFHLFEEIIGIDRIDIEKWNYYLRLFELEGKVVLDGKRFSTTDLSTGQRKRLALIVALLEEKPVLILDEWAADQDPYFRKKFYTEIIPLLKEGGLTIIAITHDDRYYHCADKLYKMDYGLLKEETIKLFEPGIIT